MANKYGFPLCLQLTPPENFMENKDFCAILEKLASLSFYGVELNLTDFDNMQPKDLEQFLAKYDLRLTVIATGVYAKTNGLYLSSTDESIRQKAVASVAKIEKFAKPLGATVVFGYMKGGVGGDLVAESAQLQRSIDELKKPADVRPNLCLEAINHYETGLVTTLDEGAAYFGEDRGNFTLLPDTYHMNIEEKNMWATMIKYRDYYNNIHVSDNNRYYPGFGAIDFFTVLGILKGMDYQGTIAIEGRNVGTIIEDVEKSCDYLAQVARRL